MGTEDEAPKGSPHPRLHGGEIAAQRSMSAAPVQVLNCNRIGRQANPPRSFGDWFRRR